MAERSDLVVGAVLMDDIVYADGTSRRSVPGGAGLYALAGAALFSRSAVLVTGTGRDLPDTFGPWLQRNGLSAAGLRLSEEHAPRNVLRYIDERTRTETPVYGMAHFRAIEPGPDDVARVIGDARSLYLFRNLDAAFWSGLEPLLARHRPVTLWEIALDACAPANRVEIEDRARRVAALSINLDEASLIYGSRDEATLIAGLRAIGTGTVFLRAGARGSYVLTPDAVRFVPSLAGDAVDVTGGGNAFGGAASIGLAEGRSPVECAAMATAAARLAISQYGPPESGSEPVRQAAADLTATLMSRLEQTP